MRLNLQNLTAGTRRRDQLSTRGSAGSGVAAPVARPDGIVKTARDGSFLFCGFVPHLGGIARVEFRSRGFFALTLLKGGLWQETNVRVGRARRGAVPLVSIRSARSTADGRIEAGAMTRSAAGRDLRRNLVIEADGLRQWRIEDRFPDRSMITGKGVHNTTTRLNREKIDAAGTMVWTTDRETRPVSGQAGELARASMITTKIRLADGEKGEARHLSWADKAGIHVRGNTHWDTAPGSLSHEAYSSESLNASGASTETSVINFLAGGSVTVSTTTSPVQGPGPMTGETYTSTTSQVYTSSDGQINFVSVDTTSITNNDDGSYSVVGSVQTIDADGQKTSVDSSTCTDAQGNTSTTTATTSPDGSVTVVTTTTDADGNGTSHSTTTDADGNVTDDTTVDVGPGDSTVSDVDEQDSSDSGGETGGSDSGEVVAGGSDSGDNGIEEDSSDGGTTFAGDAGGIGEMRWTVPDGVGEALDEWNTLNLLGGNLDQVDGREPVATQIGKILDQGISAGWADIDFTTRDRATGLKIPAPLHAPWVEISLRGEAATAGNIGSADDPRPMIAFTIGMVDAMAHTGALNQPDLSRASIALKTLATMADLVLVRAGL